MYEEIYVFSYYSFNILGKFILYYFEVCDSTTNILDIADGGFRVVNAANLGEKESTWVPRGSIVHGGLSAAAAQSVYTNPSILDITRIVRLSP